MLPPFQRKHFEIEKRTLGVQHGHWKGRRSGLNGCHPRKDMSISLSPKTVQMALFGKRVFADVIKSMMLRWENPFWIKWALNPMTSVLTRGTQRDGHLTMEAEIGVMHAPAKARHPEAPGLWRRQERAQPSSLWRERSPLTLSFQTSHFWNWKNKLLLFQVTKLVVIRFIHHRKWMGSYTQAPGWEAQPLDFHLRTNRT